MPPFVSAIELNRGFYADVVAPITAPWRHSAALIGWGSQVLGYDTERSTDHGWGPRLTIFVGDGDIAAARAAIDAALPLTYAEWPVVYGWDQTPAQHHVRVTTLEQWTTAKLGFAAHGGVTTIDWLATPQQLLLEVVRGAVYHDGLGTLALLRDRLAYLPDDVWRWMLACQWQRVGQEEAFVGRAAEVGDETSILDEKQHRRNHSRSFRRAAWVGACASFGAALVRSRARTVCQDLSFTTPIRSAAHVLDLKSASARSRGSRRPDRVVEDSHVKRELDVVPETDVEAPESFE